MNDIQFALESALNQIDTLKNNLIKRKILQVKSEEEKSLIKATVLGWFNSHRHIIEMTIGGDVLQEADRLYKNILTLCDKCAYRSKYKTLLKLLKAVLIKIRTQNIIILSNPISITERMPNFSGLISDTEMKAIIARRWAECSICVKFHAPLAATVMMGGLIESLLLARINQLSDKSKVFTAQHAPKGRLGNTLHLNEWTLRDYIEVAHELRWITQTEKDLGVVLRDYRNYIHPHKERSHNIKLEPRDASILWGICRRIIYQII